MRRAAVIHVSVPGSLFFWQENLLCQSGALELKIDELNRKLGRERKCGACPMLGKTFVGADSWNGEACAVDVLFLGLNPGIEEAKAGLPFVGPSGRFLRSAIALAPEPCSWAIANSILCSSANESAIPDPDKCRAFCRSNLGMIWKLFRPRVIVPCGNGAASVFEIGEGITRAENLWYLSAGRTGKGAQTLVAPIQHPSALIRSGGRTSSKYRNWQRRIDDIFRISRLLREGDSPERILAVNGIAWKGLFGMESGKSAGKTP